MNYETKKKKAYRALTGYGKDHLQDALKLASSLAKIFFNDNLDDYQKTRGKTHPFNRFCREGYLETIGLTRKSLTTYLRVYFVWDSYPDGKRDRLPIGIHGLLVRIKDPKTRLTLMNKALKENLSFREMSVVVQEVTGYRSHIIDQVRHLEELLDRSIAVLDEVLATKPQKKALLKSKRKIDKLGMGISSYDGRK